MEMQPLNNNPYYTPCLGRELQSYLMLTYIPKKAPGDGPGVY